jgi:hypothetical protein
MVGMATGGCFTLLTCTMAIRKPPLQKHEALGEKSRESYAKRLLFDFKRGVVGRACGCKNHTVPLPCKPWVWEPG